MPSPSFDANGLASARPTIRLNSTRPLLLAVAIGIANSGMASNSELDDSVDLGSTQVWATSISASSVNLQDDVMALKQADHISDLLRPIPGVDVGGAHSLNQRITIRSMDDKDLAISIDGAHQNTYMYHHMGNLQIHADILQSVDIDIGTNSVINGGLGGSIRFKTKEAKQLLQAGSQVGGRAQATYMDNSSNNYALTGYGQLLPQIDFLAYYNRVEKDDFNVGGGEIKDFDGNEIANTNGEVKGLAGQLDDALLKFGWDIDSKQRFAVSYETYKDEGDYSYRPDMGLATDLTITNKLAVPLTYDTEFSRETLTLNYDLKWGNNNRLTSSLYQNTSELWRDETGANAVLPNTFEYKIVEGKAINTGMNLLATSDLTLGMPQTITYGFDSIRFDTQSQGDGETRGEENAIHSAAYVQNKIFITPKFSVIPGVRYHQQEVDSKVVNKTFSATTGALAFEFQANDNVLTKVSTTQLFKAPELGEVFTGAGEEDIANDDIKAEQGFNTELAIAFEDSVLGADRFATGATVFRTVIDDYIYDYATAPEATGARSWKDNVGNMNIDGYEAYLGYDIGLLRTLLTYSVSESELNATSEYANLEGARLDRKQGDTISLSIDYDLMMWDLALHWDAQWVDAVNAGVDLDGATEDNSKDGFNVHNISARWSPRKLDGFAMTLGVENLFDEYYASQSSRTGLSDHPFFEKLYLMDYEPGRNVKLTMSYQM